MSNAYIVDGVRTAIGNIGGGLSEVRPDDLAALVIAEVVRRNPKLDVSLIGDVVIGCANQAGEDNRNVARMSLLLAGLPVSVPGETVNRLCASGMSAVANAARAVALGEGNYYIAGGVESMTRAPYAMSKASKPFARDIEIFDTSLGWRFVNPRMKALYGIDSMGQTAENVAECYGISRDEQDAFALCSQQKAAQARASGRFVEEIIPVEIPQKKGDPKRFAEDEFIRPESSLEALARLKPAFRADGGSVTAGNSSGLNDGAAALLITSEAGAEALGVTPLAKILSAAVAGVEPRLMGMGPVPSSLKALERAGLSL
jgi:acetyl-CoA acyltransferase